jgi:hypothetical protein
MAGISTIQVAATSLLRKISDPALYPTIISGPATEQRQNLSVAELRSAIDALGALNPADLVDLGNYDKELLRSAADALGPKKGPPDSTVIREAKDSMLGTIESLEEEFRQPWNFVDVGNRWLSQTDARIRVLTAVERLLSVAELSLGETATALSEATAQLCDKMAALVAGAGAVKPAGLSERLEDLRQAVKNFPVELLRSEDARLVDALRRTLKGITEGQPLAAAKLLPLAAALEDAAKPKKYLQQAATVGALANGLLQELRQMLVSCRSPEVAQRLAEMVVARLQQQIHGELRIADRLVEMLGRMRGPIGNMLRLADANPTLLYKGEDGSLGPSDLLPRSIMTPYSSEGIGRGQSVFVGGGLTVPTGSNLNCVTATWQAYVGPHMAELQALYGPEVVHEAYVKWMEIGLDDLPTEKGCVAALKMLQLGTEIERGAGPRMDLQVGDLLQTWSPTTGRGHSSIVSQVDKDKKGNITRVLTVSANIPDGTTAIKVDQPLAQNDNELQHYLADTGGYRMYVARPSSEIPRPKPAQEAMLQKQLADADQRVAALQVQLDEALALKRDLQQAPSPEDALRRLRQLIDALSINPLELEERMMQLWVEVGGEGDVPGHR